MLRLEKTAQHILIVIILIIAVADVFIIIDLILSDPVGHLTIHFN